VLEGEGIKSVGSRNGKHKEVHCKVIGCDWIGRSDHLKDRHKKEHTELEQQTYF